MSFMKRQVTHKRAWHEIDGTAGIEWFDAEDFTVEQARENYSGKIWTVETIKGYGARLSAPGYLDCAEWTVFKTVKEAEAFLEEQYGDDE